VRGKGWRAAGELRVGDEVAGKDGEWTAVTSIEETGSVATVYNCRVADFHTYFVGGSDWGFSVWAHNTYNPPANLNTNGAKSTFGIYEISINGALYKIGKADMGRITQ
jgi:hypothetical protein